MQLRDYQEDIFQQLVSSTSNALVQLDTGAGKTPIEAKIGAHFEHVMLVAHRNILITQLSEKMAAFGIMHNTVSTEYTRRRCMLSHRKHGHNPSIDRACKNKLVVSIDTLHAHMRRGINPASKNTPWLIVIDEGHHVTPGNKWGALKAWFPNARIVGFTATPARMDNESLHVSNGGLFDNLVQAKDLQKESIKALIGRGYLCDFKVLSPQEPEKIKNKKGEIELAADPAQQYIEHLKGHRAVMFCPSIKNSREFAAQFREKGISSAHIGSDLSSVEVSRRLEAFADGQIDILTNVDMVSEGFDLPGITGIIFAKKTGSFIAFRQWIGRALRPATGKSKAIIIDLVGNIAKHGLPDDHIEWDILDPPKDSGKLREAPCYSCGVWYPIKESECPECGARNKLLTREQLGDHYVEIIPRLDIGLLEHCRRSEAEKQYEDRLHKEIIWPHIPEDSGIMSSAIGRLRKWFINALEKRKVPPRQINAFLHSQQCKQEEFWLKNFTMNDLGRADKAEKVFKKWQKSH
jgi:superfamily II DNA or RNA helicase